MPGAAAGGGGGGPGLIPYVDPSEYGGARTDALDYMSRNRMSPSDLRGGFTESNAEDYMRDQPLVAGGAPRGAVSDALRERGVPDHVISYFTEGHFNPAGRNPTNSGFLYEPVAPPEEGGPPRTDFSNPTPPANTTLRDPQGNVMAGPNLSSGGTLRSIAQQEDPNMPSTQPNDTGGRGWNPNDMGVANANGGTGGQPGGVYFPGVPSGYRAPSTGGRANYDSGGVSGYQTPTGYTDAGGAYAYQGGGGGGGVQGDGPGGSPYGGGAPAWAYENPDLFYGGAGLDSVGEWINDLFPGAGVRTEPGEFGDTGRPIGFDDPNDERYNIIKLMTDPKYINDPFHLPGKPTATYAGLTALERLAAEQTGRGRESEQMIRDLVQQYQSANAGRASDRVAGEVLANPYTTSSSGLQAKAERRAAEEIESGRAAGEQSMRDRGMLAGPGGTEAALALNRDANRARSDAYLGIEDEFTKRRAQDLLNSSKISGDAADVFAQMTGQPTAALADQMRQPYDPYRYEIANILMQLGNEQSAESIASRQPGLADYVLPIAGGFGAGAGQSIGKELFS